MNSIWSKTLIPRRNALPGDCKTEIAVIGGGMAGILTAYYLQQKGKQVIVLEADRIGSGQTKGTTAKISLQHNLIYQTMIQNFGIPLATQYVRANQAALLQYRQLIQSQSIFCHYEELPSFLYSTSVSEPLKQEEEAARKLGVSADFLTQTELPFSLSGALCFPNQAQFHPLEFLQALSQELTIYETTTALSVKGNRIVTNHGAVTAEHIVFACHYPFINVPGFYFSKMYQQRSYSLALSKAQPLHGMYLSIDPSGLSFRQSGDLLLFGGGGHRCGKIPTVNPYQALQSTARLFWPECKVAAHWSAQDAMTLDGLPYIGQFSSVRPNWYVATGFNKWGMSASMVAAMLLSDRICGKSNPYAAIFSPRRFSLKASFSDGTAHLAESAKGLLLGASGSPARCSHMGCKLSWNPAESTWECPCHGSRFDHSGHLLNGPAQMDLRF